MDLLAQRTEQVPPLTALRRMCFLTFIEARLRKIKKKSIIGRRGTHKNGSKHTSAKKNGNGNGHLPIKKSHPVTDGSLREVHHSILDPMKYMLKLPKHKKVSWPNGQVRFEKTEADYLPRAARIAWFRKDHPFWSIVTDIEQLADKAVVMKATIKDMQGVVIATARKKETEADFPD